MVPIGKANMNSQLRCSKPLPSSNTPTIPQFTYTNFEMLVQTGDRETDHRSASSVHQTGKDPHTRDPPSPRFDDDFDIFGAEMIPGTGGSSPFIKDEPHEWNFNDAPTMNPEGSNYGNMPMNSFNGQIASGSVDPSELHGNAFNQFSFGNDNMTSSLIADDELNSLDLSNAQKLQAQNGISGGFFNNATSNNSGSGMQPPQQPHQQGMFAQTPQGEPAQSPYLQGMQPNQMGSYPGQQFHGQQQPQPQQPQQSQQQMSPFMGASRPSAPPLSREASYMSARPRNSMSIAMERKASDSRSPMTPRTPAIGQLNLGTPEGGSMPQPIHGMSHRHQKSISGQWESQLGSYDSYAAGSPMASPAHLNHPQISEVLKGGKPSSLPSKVDHPNPGYQSVEAKRRRRRESHNLVERRRRDNINERIQELAHLVPGHRLEDEKVRKHLNTNSPISPGLVPTGVSPPQASLLAQKRASASNLTMGLPLEDKDKGPNKGDILNGSVAWTRDLVWYTHTKLQQEAQLRELVSSLGGQWPFGETEDEKRMHTELVEVFEKLPLDSFEYSRGHGSGLRVPKHTNLAGEPLSEQSMGSPGTKPQGGIAALRAAQEQSQQFWNGSAGGQGSLAFTKEEDEFNMEMQ